MTDPAMTLTAGVSKSAITRSPLMMPPQRPSTARSRNAKRPFDLAARSVQQRRAFLVEDQRDDPGLQHVAVTDLRKGRRELRHPVAARLPRLVEAPEREHLLLVVGRHGDALRATADAEQRPRIEGDARDPPAPQPFDEHPLLGPEPLDHDSLAFEADHDVGDPVPVPFELGSPDAGFPLECGDLGW